VVTREEHIAELRERNEQARAEIERRQAARENDPAAFDRAERDHQRMEAERETAGISHGETAGISHGEWAEPIRSTYVQKFGSDDVLYRVHDENEQTGSAESLRTGLCDDNPPAESDNEAQALDRFTAAVTRALDDDARRLAALERANIELRAKLDTLFQLLGTGGAKKLWVP
jgi:hypothetical protein